MLTSTAPPTATHRPEESHDTPLRLGVFCGGVDAAHVRPPFRVTITSACPDWELPTPTQLLAETQLTPRRSAPLASSWRSAHVLPPLLVVTTMGAALLRGESPTAAQKLTVGHAMLQSEPTPPGRGSARHEVPFVVAYTSPSFIAAGGTRKVSVVPTAMHRVDAGQLTALRRPGRTLLDMPAS